MKNEIIDISSVVIIGEYTTSAGPFFDDHFLALVYISGEVAAYPTGQIKELVLRLEKTTGVKINWDLCNETEAASRIIFPTILAEHPLFYFERPKFEIASLLKTIRDFGIVEISTHLTNGVTEYINDIRSQSKRR